MGTDMDAPGRQAEQWLRERTQRTLVIVGLGAVVTCFTLITPLFIIFVGWMHHRHAQNLMQRGVKVRAEIIGLRQGVTRIPATAAEAWEDIDHGIPDGGQANVMALIHAAVMLMHPVVAALAMFIPLIIVRYSFELEGEYRIASRYMFANERFHVDDDGSMWAWVDPRRPTLNTWLISRMQ